MSMAHRRRPARQPRRGTAMAARRPTATSEQRPSSGLPAAIAMFAILCGVILFISSYGEGWLGALSWTEESQASQRSDSDSQDTQAPPNIQNIPNTPNIQDDTPNDIQVDTPNDIQVDTQDDIQDTYRAAPTPSSEAARAQVERALDQLGQATRSFDEGDHAGGFLLLQQLHTALDQLKDTLAQSDNLSRAPAATPSDTPDNQDLY